MRIHRGAVHTYTNLAEFIHIFACEVAWYEMAINRIEEGTLSVNDLEYLRKRQDLYTVMRLLNFMRFQYGRHPSIRVRNYVRSQNEKANKLIQKAMALENKIHVINHPACVA